MFELNNFDSIQIGIASPEKIREWSYGEVKKPETINYRTQKPEKEGLFCERIFGPTKDWECNCGKYKRIRYKGVVCDKCGVEVTRAKVRRERMGHIELAAPVAHIWYSRGVPSRIGLILGISPKQLDQVISYMSWIVLDKGSVEELSYKQVIPDREYHDLVEKYGSKSFRVGMGAESIKELLKAIDLEKESAELKAIVQKSTGQKRLTAIKRLDIVESFRRSGNRPEWMVLDVLPVLPPELRPMVQLDGGRFATSDLNDLYRRVINRNNRLKRLAEIGSPDLIIRNEKRMLQQAVDSLIDNGRRGKAVSGPGNRDLKSLSGMLRGKNGRFRQNLLGKRVDYSGRSVIVVGPELKLHQCGLPKEMALELFKPFVMKELVSREIAPNIKSAKKKVEHFDKEVWDVLEDVIKGHPVMLNRAPTLHRLSIQAFEPVLIEGRAIKLHPLVCGAFNADFDGDQMAVHVPLSKEAQNEARFLMLSTNDVLKLSNGKPVVSLTQDMILGSYYLTLDKDGEKGEGSVFRDFDEAMMAYQTGNITLQSKIRVRMRAKVFKRGNDFYLDNEVYNNLDYSVTELDRYCRIRATLDEQLVDGEEIVKIIDTTLGKMIFNKAIPQNLGIRKRETKKDLLELEVVELVKKGTLSKIVDATYKLNGATKPESLYKTAETLDKIKAQGYKYSTISAITTSVFDMQVPEVKKQILADAESKVVRIEKQYRRGLLSEKERYDGVIKVWQAAEKDVTEALKGTLDKYNPIWMMADSGARGSMDQIRQLSGMRGLMSNTVGKTIEVPVKSSFREGLTVLEYFISSHGGRKGLADTALKTADSGYLTRRLVDVAQEIIVREEDCCAGLEEPAKGLMVSAIRGSGNREIIEPLRDRIEGRFVVRNVVDPKSGEILATPDTMITAEQAKIIEDAGVTEVEIRSVLTCRSKNGVCSKCYGKNMANGSVVGIGEAVGIISAQSIGEPGTQLTMRTFHSGGVAGSDDITRGLPRVEELFEARRPKGMAFVSDYSGTVQILEGHDGSKSVIVKLEDGTEKEYPILNGAQLLVANGEKVEPGTVLNAGSVNPNDILRTKGIRGVQNYIIKEVQSIYRSQGVEIDDKHIEVIVRQMLKKVKIEDEGDTDLLPGELMDVGKYEEANRRALEAGGRPATAKRTLLGITKASLATESFLSAASFQETAKVLTEAAIKCKVDPLNGLKENIIIGKLIPAGTGLIKYNSNVVGAESDYMGIREKVKEYEAKKALEEGYEDGYLENTAE